MILPVISRASRINLINYMRKTMNTLQQQLPVPVKPRSPYDGIPTENITSGNRNTFRVR